MTQSSSKTHGLQQEGNNVSFIQSSEKGMLCSDWVHLNLQGDWADAGFVGHRKMLNPAALYTGSFECLSLSSDKMVGNTVLLGKTKTHLQEIYMDYKVCHEDRPSE